MKKWGRAVSVITESQLRRENQVLKSRVNALESHLEKAAEAIERDRRAKAKVIKAAQTRKRRRSDKIRVVFGDVHGSLMIPDAIAALLADIQSLEPDEILIGGDLLECGGFLAQHHTLGYVAQTQYTYEEDQATANEFLDALREAAPNAQIEMMEGNHEGRIQRWIVTETLRNHADAEYLHKIMGAPSVLRLKERGIPYYSRNVTYGNCRQPGFIQKGKCFFVHQVSSAKNAAAAALDRVAANIVFFHTHRAQAAISFKPGVGNIGAWNPGCLCELRPMWQHTNPNEWTHGYGVQLISSAGNFLHINVPIVDGDSLLIPLTTKR